VQMGWIQLCVVPCASYTTTLVNGSIHEHGGRVCGLDHFGGHQFRCRSTWNQHRTDHQVGICDRLGDVHRVGGQGIETALVGFFKFGQACQVQINDLDIGTHTGGNHTGRLTGHTATNDHNTGTPGAGHATHQHTGATL